MTAHLYISFHVTADAIQTRIACEKQGLAGKLVPVPRAMSAGCGMAWRSDVKDEEAIKALLEKEDIEIEDMRIL